MSFGISCNSKAEYNEDFIYLGDSLETSPNRAHGWTGVRLAHAYCGGCHLRPEPDLLSKKLWEEYVLPDMGRRLGVTDVPAVPFGDESAIQTLIYPNDPRINEEDWQSIVRYYLEHAPDEMHPQPEKPAVSELKGFKIRGIQIQENIAPSSSLVKIDESGSSVFVGAGHTAIYHLNQSMEIKEILRVGSTPSGIVKTEEGDVMALGMGIMIPSEQKSGQLVKYSVSSDEPQVLLDGLHRPVDIKLADLNQDGREDLMVCNFGHHTGYLAWYEHKEDGSYERHILRENPGAIQSWITDFNQDGLPDIVVLIAQAEQTMIVYINQGGGNFEEKELLRFPPVYGSSYFELADMTGNGYKDIIYVNGDNGDFTPVPKFYHGVRIFENDGEGNFEETYFYPMYGAQKAMAADFNNDGRLDIAAIAFFPDYSEGNPESFVLLKNETGDNGNLKFEPKSFSQQNDGQWLTMDVGDISGNGYPDILLGSFIIGPNDAPEHTYKSWQEKGYHIVYLENLGLE